MGVNFPHNITNCCDNFQL